MLHNKTTKQKNGDSSRRKSDDRCDQAEKNAVHVQRTGEIAHDIKNKLFSIVANTRRIKKTHSDNTFVMEHIEKIEKAAQDATDLTIRLLTSPQSETVSKVHEIPQEPPVRLDNLQALLIDDEEVIRDILKEILQEYNMFVKTFNDGRKALDYYKQHWEKVDLIFLDMMMPEMKGPEVFYALREINSEAKVILFSGYTHDSSMQDLLENGALGFIEKPADYATLYNTIAQMLSNSDTDT